MENNTPQVTITVPVDEKDGKVEALMRNRLETLPSISMDNCCIYKVPEFIRGGDNEKFYRPSVMSIGPIYYKDKDLETMQEVKWIYLNCFLKHPQNAYPSLERYIKFARENEDKIRSCYQEKNRLLSDEFIEMIVLDAAFLVYYLMTHSRMLSLDRPSIENKLQGLMLYLVKDLFLLDNQLPYFVLTSIFDIAFGNVYEPRALICVSLVCIGLTGIPGFKAINDIIEESKITDASSIKHLVDLQRTACCLSLKLPLRGQENTNAKDSSVSYIQKGLSCICRLLCYRRRYLKREEDPYFQYPYTAKQLKDAGVKFEGTESENPLDITYKNGKLKISKLNIDDNTEPFLRSMIFFEQCHYSKDSYFIDYIFFLDELIDTVEDVQILVKNEILTNHLGSDEYVINLFNNIGKNLNLSCSFYYSNVAIAVNRYASTRWNRWMAILRRNYFNHPWAIMSVIFALTLFILTLLQTINSFIY